MTALRELTEQASRVLVDPNDDTFRQAAASASRILASQVLSDSSPHIAAAMRSMLLALPAVDPITRFDVLEALKALARVNPSNSAVQRSPWWVNHDD